MTLVPPKTPRAPGAQLGEAVARGMILEGAARTFAEQGVRATTIEDVLRAADVSRRTFYRLYESKEDVLVALYRLGTARLLEGCRRAMAEERDPIRRLERCVDAHLVNARDFGRLVFVLGGEAQRQESALHPHRMEAHEALVAMLAASDEQGHDPLLFRTLVLALEAATRRVLEEGDEGRRVSPAELDRVRSVMARLSAVVSR